MGVINFNPKENELLKTLNYSFINGDSYEILLRYYGNNKYEVSISELCQFISEDYTNIKKVRKYEENKDKINAQLKQFYSDFNSLRRNIKENSIIDDSEINKIKEKYKDIDNILNNYYFNINNYNEFEEIDKSIFYYLYYYKEFLILFKLNEENKNILGYRAKINFEKVNELAEKNILDFINNCKNLIDSLSLIQTYNTHCLNSIKTNKQIQYISFIDVEKLNHNNPYFIAINFLKQIFTNIKETSKLYEILSNLDSEVIKNLLIEKKEKEIYILNYNDIYGYKKEIKYDKIQLNMA